MPSQPTLFTVVSTKGSLKGHTLDILPDSDSQANLENLSLSVSLNLVRHSDNTLIRWADCTLSHSQGYLEVVKMALTASPLTNILLKSFKNRQSPQQNIRILSLAHTSALYMQCQTQLEEECATQGATMAALHHDAIQITTIDPSLPLVSFPLRPQSPCMHWALSNRCPPQAASHAKVGLHHLNIKQGRINTVVQKNHPNVVVAWV
ncbi:hypothetical protein BDK51DRAFT_32525 [Blyttiomyces helicus]|uniref:Uncharacterized protein n=1 Tax=Blyttiomyces helicus TaxID=388810 RepID=A0A4P9WBA2_9FUNG|nr:hypothetical protein BDK51DRAFT_32525 [Blyttiomyces helicus]|eukprot:RKO89901.1 hypothetical protein BDK51DRAFT_32525 [Blyttiomyces helicus]